MLKIIIITLFVLGLLSISPVIAYGTDEWIDITVKEKERVVGGSGGKYLVFTDNEVFQNTDSWWYWKFNSADFYSDIEEGKDYKVRAYGFRIPFLSKYRNIIEINSSSN